MHLASSGLNCFMTKKSRGANPHSPTFQKNLILDMQKSSSRSNFAFSFKKMQQESKSLVDYDNAIEFNKSLKELRSFSSQLYNAASYCETAFLNAQNKNIVVGNTREYVSRAVVTFVDHLGSISATLECCISQTNSVPQTETRISTLEQRIGTCQEYSNKLGLHRFYCTSQFSRFNCRYISPPSTVSAVMNPVASRILEIGIDAKNANDNQFETEEPLFMYTYNCKPSLTEKSTRKMEKTNGRSPQVLPVRDGLSILPKADQSNFQFQEDQKLKRGTINWKLVHNKEISSLIRRGKRILT